MNEIIQDDELQYRWSKASKGRTITYDLKVVTYAYCEKRKTLWAGCGGGIAVIFQGIDDLFEAEDVIEEYHEKLAAINAA